VVVSVPHEATACARSQWPKPGIGDSRFRWPALHAHRRGTASRRQGQLATPSRALKGARSWPPRAPTRRIAASGSSSRRRSGLQTSRRAGSRAASGLAARAGAPLRSRARHARRAHRAAGRACSVRKAHLPRRARGARVHAAEVGRGLAHTLISSPHAWVYARETGGAQDEHALTRKGLSRRTARILVSLSLQPERV